MKPNKIGNIRTKIFGCAVPFPGIHGNAEYHKCNSSLRKIIYITGFIGAGLCFNACKSTGYVANEPTYVQYSRPPQPSEVHIWINGDWAYNQKHHVYTQRNGYWEKPNPRRIHVPGYWKSGPRGKYWVAGRYERVRY
jgi:hypothetical protein